MDHMDGIKDLFDEFTISNIWDTKNKKEISNKADSGGYNIEDWKFYKSIRDSKNESPRRLTYYAKDINQYYNEDYIKILCPTPSILKECNEKGNWNDSSYVILYTPPKNNGSHWKIIFAGDSEDITWDYILENFEDEVTNIDILFAPHHGRNSGRNFDFLKTLTPTVTLFGNASSKHLEYNSYNSEIKVTNNQAGYVIMDIQGNYIDLYVKNLEFARDFRYKRNWGEPVRSAKFDGYHLVSLNP